MIGAEVREEGGDRPARHTTSIGSLSADLSLAADDRHRWPSSRPAQLPHSRESAADFEMLPELDHPLSFELAQHDLFALLSQTVFATSRDETRPILTGALFNISPGGLEVVSTDTYRLALRRMIVEIPIERTCSAIISQRALNEVLRIVEAESDEPVRLELSSNQVSFTIGNVIVGSRLIEGQFPNYER